MLPSFAPATNTPLSHDPNGNPNSSLFFYNPLAINDDDETYRFYFEDTLLDNNYHSLIDDQQSYQCSNTSLANFTPHFSISEQNPVLHDKITSGSSSRSSENCINFSFKPQPNGFHIDSCMRETVNFNIGSKVAFRMKTKLEVVDDGYKWRKYGKKKVKSSPHPRNYYHCATIGCKVKKRIERDIDDPSYVITTYDEVHNHKRSS